MLNPSRDWIEQIKYVVQDMINQKNFVLTGIVTSIDPTPPYKVKVTLEPYSIETGWLKLAMPLAGNGYGVLLPPPDEGTEVRVLFDLGDIKSGTVIGAVYDDQAVQMPPDAAALGTMGLYHKSGSFIRIAPDGTVTIKGKNTTTTF